MSSSPSWHRPKPSGIENMASAGNITGSSAGGSGNHPAFLSLPPVVHFQIKCPSPKKQKSRLNRKGINILREFARTHGVHPTHEQLEVLVQKVKDAGNGHWRMVRAKAWFSRLIVKDAQTPSVVGGASATQNLGTVLNARQMETLRRLRTETPNPSESLVTAWANLSGVEVSVVEEFLHDTRPVSPAPLPQRSVDQDVVMHDDNSDASPAVAEASVSSHTVANGPEVQSHRPHHPESGLRIVPPRQRLPTPAPTGSPAPSCYSSTTSTYEFKPDFIQSHSRRSSLMITPTSNFASIPPTPVIFHSQTPMQTGPTPPTLKTVPDSLLLKAIMEGIREVTPASSLSIPRPALPPQSVAEFNALWAAFEPKFANLARAFDMHL